MEFGFYLPVKIFFGDDVVVKNSSEFRKLGRKALIVTGRNSSKINGSLDDVIRALEKEEIEYKVFNEVEENPSLETIEKGAEIGKKFDAHFIIGVGGGSPLDASKAIALFIKNPDLNIDNAFTSEKLESIPVAAIATTSGTGSEVTQYSIVTVNKEKTKKNLGQEVFPKIAFLDSKYTSALSYEITVNTAIDAFTHLVEGYLNVNSTLASEIYGEKGFEIFSRCFKKLLDNNLDKKFREEVMAASTIAGIQIAQTGTSLPHGMGYALTYNKGLPHGLANGVLTIEYLKSFKEQSKIRRMLKLLDLKSIDELSQIFNKLFKVDIAITEQEIVEYATSFAANKAKLKNHTEVVTTEDIIKIYKNSLLK
ncbi:iron-containing alcohol dehydrogenase family protein [Clostridium manihotivorum]|uniref:Alcohol dehydrogenase n=1 Tax=Clostridium manihotivorum TaxID=2320868 RepID=A0A3R5UEW9_9CLOT|nr:iron-containing alcohol dehydrogenase family protein [Clostridium manihotivorum]QAA31830.1 alcohol dehydrogenase [Clostridium manihotivorum]